MKQLLLLAALASATNAWAQAPVTTVVSVGAFGLAPNAGLQLEHRLTRHFSLGLQGTRYFGNDYPGYQAALLGRYYFRPTAPAGFYAQAQFGVFQHTGQIQAYYYPDRVFPPSDVRLGGSGGGLGLGYQLLLGQHLALNAGLGLKFYHIRSLGVCDCSYVGDWYATGQPGSLLDGQLNVGYAF
jgi:hypothetical protein